MVNKNEDVIPNKTVNVVYFRKGLLHDKKMVKKKSQLMY